MRKEPDDLEFRSYSRVGFVSTYLEIAIDCYLDLIADRKEYQSIIDKGGEYHDGSFFYYEHDRELELTNRQRKGTIKVVIFVSIFLESYINQLAGIVFGDKYSKEHLDKLDFISKWIIIPRLITGKELNKSHAYFGRLKTMSKWRNKLVHHKSKDASFLNQPWTKEKAEQFRPLYEQIDVDGLFLMIEELFKALDLIDKPGYHLFSISKQMERLRNV